MGICTKLGLSPFSLPSDHDSRTRILSLATYRTVTWTRFRNPYLSSLRSVQQNTALDVFVFRPMCVSLRFLWGANRAPRPLEYMALIADHVLLEMSYVTPGMPGVARAS